MDFGEVLRQWEDGDPKRSERDRRRMEEWIDEHPPDHPQNASLPDESPQQRRERIKRRRPQRVLDLHGVRASDAARRVDAFVAAAVRDGIEKALIIHGKGKHSHDPRGGVLKQVVYEALRAHPHAGEMGVPDRRLGGSGAVWVAIRYRSR